MEPLCKVLAYARKMVGAVIIPGDIAIDATVGNGTDTTFLAERVGPSGVVYGFDIQRMAIQIAKKRLDESGLLKRVRLKTVGHENLWTQTGKDAKGTVRAIMFNLGYLPGGDKQITTIASATISGLQQAISLLTVGGRLSVVCYPGHKTGKDEAAAVLNWAQNLDQHQFDVLHYAFINQKNDPPFLVLVQRRK